MHMRVHEGVKPYTCPQCGKQVRTTSALNSHIRTHTGEKSHACELCNKSFTNSGGLRIHSRIHVNERPYECGACGKCFVQSSALREHTKRMHTGERPHSCEQCPKRFYTAQTLHASVYLGRREGCDSRRNISENCPWYSLRSTIWRLLLAKQFSNFGKHWSKTLKIPLMAPASGNFRSNLPVRYIIF